MSKARHGDSPLTPAHRSGQPALPADLVAIIEARHHDPFAILGLHADADTTLVRAYIPGARRVGIDDAGIALQRVPGS
ncbi:MAG: glgB, partial [Proteobacteria bacterium]|nr:glgB [Pseudomonadota bacterium]